MEHARLALWVVIIVMVLCGVIVSSVYRAQLSHPTKAVIQPARIALGWARIVA